MTAEQLCGTFYNAASSWAIRHGMIERFMNDELKSMWKEAVIIYPRCYSGICVDAEENHEKLVQYCHCPKP
jgi:hypothetical protein